MLGISGKYGITEKYQKGTPKEARKGSNIKGSGTQYVAMVT